MDPLAIFLDPLPSDSPLWEFAPPGPAVYRREWCRLEERGAVEYRDPLAPRPGVHRMKVQGVENELVVCVGLGGRRLRAAHLGPLWSACETGMEIEVHIRPRRAEHWVTPAGLHLVGPGDGWRVYRTAAEAEAEAGPTQAEITRIVG